MVQHRFPKNIALIISESGISCYARYTSVQGNRIKMIWGLSLPDGATIWQKLWEKHPQKGRSTQRRSRRFSSQLAECFQLSVHRKQMMI
jgi:hypothetical protein